MISDIETYLERRKNLYPQPQFFVVSEIKSGNDVVYIAKIDNRFSGEIKETITDAINSLVTVLEQYGEI
jgi:hypothetical protein